ncbi:hypothetical protein BDV95DRAFT_562594 [Massariosphaeria phaeospora]|uniref:Uncharacterized protein n=1 Tax=Massariosphaeria phaeospora TaxID=100035 RepID=A0A7C8MHT0_9PLEO|nr:hypothetical protein BDV95DRAFT_562594 [Massariosphaeria phaeospora]
MATYLPATLSAGRSPPPTCNTPRQPAHRANSLSSGPSLKIPLRSAQRFPRPIGPHGTDLDRDLDQPPASPTHPRLRLAARGVGPWPHPMFCQPRGARNSGINEANSLQTAALGAIQHVTRRPCLQPSGWHALLFAACAGGFRLRAVWKGGRGRTAGEGKKAGF